MRTRSRATKGRTVLALLLMGMLTGCAAWPRAGLNGLVFTNVTTPVAVLDAEAANVKTGEACAFGLLGIFATGNSTIVAAKQSIGITKIATVEEHFQQILFGAYTSYCVVVTGT